VAPTPEPYAVAARTLLRDRILDAAHALLRGRGWDEISLAQVAAGAGISRQTIYNEFGNRRALAQAYVLREGERFLAEVDAAVAAHAGDPRGALAAALGGFLAHADDHPLLRAIATGQGADELLGAVASHDSPVVRFATERLAATLTGGWMALDAPDARLLSDHLVRLAISYAALPAGDAATTAAGVARALGPFIDELVSGA
jgi:AcrR family transcriptional regulator